MVTSMAPTLLFENLPEIFPKEIRENIYYQYFQPPSNEFTHPNLPWLLAPISALKYSHPELFDEIIFVAKRTAARAQHVLLTTENTETSAFAGFPKQVVNVTDWLNIRYVVMLVPFFECSVRTWQGVTQSLDLCVPKKVSEAWTTIKKFQDTNPHLVNLTKVRFDLSYDVKHEKDFSDQISLPLTDLVSTFTLAKTVWAEPAGSITNEKAMTVVRVFNQTRRIFDKTNVHKNILNLVTGILDGNGMYKKKDYKLHPSNVLEHEQFEKAEELIEFCKGTDWGVENGLATQIFCEGCFARFNSERAPHLNPEEITLTRKLYQGHCYRSAIKFGEQAPCKYGRKEHYELD